MRSVLVTRPRAAAEAFAERLRHEGLTVAVAPLMEYVPVAADLSGANGADALVFTSVQAVTLFAEQSAVRGIPVFAVGDATAQAAAAAGFTRVYTSNGDSSSLAGLIRARQPALQLRKMFHPAGEDTAEDLGRLLAKDDISVTRVTLYKANFIDTLPAETEEALRLGTIDTVTLFSARTAENFVRIMKQKHMKGASSGIDVICLSPRVSKELRGLKWRTIHVAKTPNMNAVVALLTEKDHAGATLMADPVIAAFGGIRPMATRLGIAASTVQGWKNRYVIPEAQLDIVIAAAEEDGINIESFWREERKPMTDTGAAPSDGERRRGTDRRQTPATFDERGYVVSPNYVGPDRRSGVDRREQHAKVQQERIHREKVRFLWRTILSAGFLTSAIIYAAVFLLMPEYSNVKKDADHVREMQVQMAAMNKRLLELQRQHHAKAPVAAAPSAGSAISHGIEQAESMAANAGDTLMTGTQTLMQILTNVQRLNATPEGPAAMSSIMDRLKGVLAAAPADPAALNEAVDDARQEDPALKSVIGPVETKDLGAAAMLLALGELRQNVSNQESFEDDLLILQKFSANDPEMQRSLARLAPYARSGVLSRAALQETFKQTAADIVMAKLRGEDVSIRDQVTTRLSRLVKVRREGEVIEGKEADAVVARAQDMLDKGDIRGAMAELKTLEGPEAEAAKPWMQQATGTVTAHDSTSLLAQLLMQKLAGSTASGGGLQSIVPDLLHQLQPPDAAPYLSPALRPGTGGTTFPTSP